MGARSSFISFAAFVSGGGPRRNRGRFFYALPLLFLAFKAEAAQSWDLLVEVDAAGHATVISSKPRSNAVVPPPQALREGLTCIELRDDAGRLVDRRAVPLEPEVLYERSDAPGRLSGGSVPAPRMQYEVRVPRKPGVRLSLQFFHVSRRSPATSARSLAPAQPEDFVLDPRGAATLDAVP